MLSDKVRLALVVIVGGGWLFNLMAPAFVTTYESNLAANAPLMLVLGAIFATSRTKKPSGSGDE